MDWALYSGIGKAYRGAGKLGETVSKMRPKRNKRLSDLITDVNRQMDAPDVSNLEMIKLRKVKEKLMKESDKQLEQMLMDSQRYKRRASDTKTSATPQQLTPEEQGRRDFLKQSAAATGVTAPQEARKSVPSGTCSNW